MCSLNTHIDSWVSMAHGTTCALKLSARNIAFSGVTICQLSVVDCQAAHLSSLRGFSAQKISPHVMVEVRLEVWSSLTATRSP